MKKFQGIKKQRGNAMLTLIASVVLGAIIAAFGIPKIDGMLTEAKVEPVSADIQRWVTRVKVSNSGSGTQPYDGLTQASFAQTMRGTSLEVGTIAGQGTGDTVVRHGMGGGNDGTVVLSQTGDTFSLTFNNVDLAACPSLATSLQRAFQGITVNGQAVKVTATNGTVTTGYTASSAATRCNDGSDNVFVFTSR
ncbi:type 4 pilus major pilin [Pseudomonas sp. EMN2]|uniref:type 4 pilus major pilin n=1 Tax=Pseudomonas sp. EMN2 TaxID=2615212 RepID=UPI00129A4037|nr:type 4 pilus major pilin [Pseudomonas sp. EMN2]